jgi:uncharacterized membrane protein
MPVISLVRIAAGALFILFLPGFAWTWVFYDKEKTGALERVVYSVALSIALLSAAFFFCNLFLGIGINMLSSFIIVSILTILAPAHIRLRRMGAYRWFLPRRWRERA